ncbi:MAG: HAD family phosphatase [Planctomycetia bacterium]|nr:HAD family phosphatase [Planctomycetia bacterium]
MIPLSFPAIVFDFNGTLFWDTPQHNEAWFRFCDRYGIPLSAETMFRKYHGKNNEMILADMFEGRLSPEEIEDYSQRKELLYQEICLRQGMELAPGAEAFLDFLKERNVPFTIATASIPLNVQFYFEKFQLSRWFDYDRVILNDGTLPGKPNPEVYLQAIRMLGETPEKVLVFEDSPTGISAALNAGIQHLILVNSNNDDYSRWNFPVIRSFDEVARAPWLPS